MHVTITVENGDQQVEVTRTAADIMGGAGRPIGQIRDGIERVFDLAVGDARRACQLPPVGKLREQGQARP